MAKETGEQKGEVVGTVREWEPHHAETLGRIHAAVDGLGRAPGEPAPINRDHAAIAAAVDRITRRVRTRKVVVKETVTEYVDAEGPVEVHAASTSHAVDEATAPTPPVEDGKKGGFLSRLRKGKEKAPATDAAAPVAPVPTSAAPDARATAAGDGDAWDPSQARPMSSSAGARPVSPPKPLQSKAARRTAGKTARKGSRKR